VDAQRWQNPWQDLEDLQAQEEASTIKKSARRITVPAPPETASAPSVKNALTRWWQWMNSTQPVVQSQLPAVRQNDHESQAEWSLTVKLSKRTADLNQRVMNQLRQIGKPRYFGWEQPRFEKIKAQRRQHQLNPQMEEPSLASTPEPRQQVQYKAFVRQPVPKTIAEPRYTSNPNAVVIDALFSPITTDNDEIVVQQRIFEDLLPTEPAAAGQNEPENRQTEPKPVLNGYVTTSRRTQQPLTEQPANPQRHVERHTPPSTPEPVETPLTYPMVPYAEAFEDISINQYNHRVYQNLFLARQIDQLASRYFEQANTEAAQDAATSNHEQV
jgi:hypothetical protein